MKMKINKILLVVVLMITTNIIVAQSEKVSIGIRAGIDFQNINGTDQQGDKLEFLLVPRYNAGVTVQVPIATDFLVQS